MSKMETMILYLKCSIKEKDTIDFLRRIDINDTNDSGNIKPLICILEEVKEHLDEAKDEIHDEMKYYMYRTLILQGLVGMRYKCYLDLLLGRFDEYKTLTM